MNEVEVVVSDKFISRGGFGAAKKGMKDLTDDAQKAEKSVGAMNEEITNGFAKRGGTSKIAGEFDKLTGTLAKSGRTAGDAAGDGFSDGLSGGVSRGASGVGGTLTSALGGLAGIGGAAGALIGGVFMDGLAANLDRSAIQGQLKAQYKLSTAEAAEAGKTAGAVYTSGIGESIGQTSQVVGAVRASFKGLADDGANSLESISKGALTVSSVFGTDVNEVIRATSQLLKNGLAPDAATALDIVAAGFQNGMDVGGDFLDTINEYSPYFKQLGLSATEGLGLVSQFLQAGARDADYAADAVKEFGIRAIDGSKGTVNAFKDIGLNAEEMAAKVAQGGPAAKEALGQVIAALQGMKDPIAQNTAGVGLFGTQWEDTVRAILPNLDLTNAGLKDVKGSVDGMNKAITGTDASKLDQLGRKFAGIAESVAGAALDWGKLNFGGAPELPAAVKDEIDKQNKTQAENNELLAKRNQLTTDAAATQTEFNKQLESGNYQQKIGISTAAELGSANGELFASQQELLRGNQLLTEATGNNQAANESNLNAFLRLKDGGYQVVGSLSAVVTGMSEAELAATGATVKVDGLGNAVISMPGQKDIQIDAKTLSADAALQGTINRIAAVQSKTVTITVQELYQGSRASGIGWGVGGYAHGGITSTAATGGLRGGFVTMNEQGPEAVRLPNGSTVIPAGATRALEHRWSDSIGRDSVDYGSISDDLWRKLMAEGWTGRAGDGAERLYRPSNYASPARRQEQQVVFDIQPGVMSGLEQVFLTWLKNAVRIRGGDPRVLGN